MVGLDTGRKTAPGSGRATDYHAKVISGAVFLALSFGVTPSSWRCFSMGAARTNKLSNLPTLGAIGRPGESASPQTRSQPHASVAGLCSAGLVLMAACRSFGKQSSSTTTRRAFENETGVQPPLGFFDPLGFTNDGDVSDFYRRREVELKNGRVAMFATIGYIAPEWFRFPGTLTLDAETKFSAMPNGLKALDKVPIEGWLQIIGWCGFLELCVNTPQNSSEPGNYGRGKFGISPGESISDPEKRKSRLNSELANGRLAMMAIVGMWFQDGLTGSAWGDWSLYTASPLRARASELL